MSNTKVRKVWTDKEAAEYIRSIRSGDYERHHSDGDGVLCQILEQLGFIETVKAWDELEKWYA